MAKLSWSSSWIERSLLEGTDGVRVGPASLTFMLDESLQEAGEIAVACAAFDAEVKVPVKAGAKKVVAQVVFKKPQDFAVPITVRTVKGKITAPPAKDVRVVPLRLGFEDSNAISAKDHELGNDGRLELKVKVAGNFKSAEAISGSISGENLKSDVAFTLPANAANVEVTLVLTKTHEEPKPLVFKGLPAGIAADGARAIELKVAPPPTFAFADGDKWIGAPGPYATGSRVRVTVKRTTKNLVASDAASISGSAVGDVKTPVSFAAGVAQADVELTFKGEGTSQEIKLIAAGKTLATKTVEVAAKRTVAFDWSAVGTPAITPEGPYRPGDKVTLHVVLSGNAFGDGKIGTITAVDNAGKTLFSPATIDVKTTRGEKKIDIPATIADVPAGTYKLQLALDQGPLYGTGRTLEVSAKVVKLPVLGFVDSMLSNPVKAIAGRTEKPSKKGEFWELPVGEKVTFAVKLDVGDATSVPQVARAELVSDAWEAPIPVEFAKDGKAEMEVVATPTRVGDFVVRLRPAGDPASCTGLAELRTIRVSRTVWLEPPSAWSAKGPYVAGAPVKVKLSKSALALPGKQGGFLLKCGNFDTTPVTCEFAEGQDTAEFTVRFKSTALTSHEITLESANPRYLLGERQKVSVEVTTGKLAFAATPIEPAGPYVRGQKVKLSFTLSLPSPYEDTELANFKGNGIVDDFPVKFPKGATTWQIEKEILAGATIGTTSLDFESPAPGIAFELRSSRSIEVVEIPALEITSGWNLVANRPGKLRAKLKPKGSSTKLPPGGASFELRCDDLVGSPVAVQMTSAEKEIEVTFTKTKKHVVKVANTKGCDGPGTFDVTLEEVKGWISWPEKWISHEGPFAVGDEVTFTIKREAQPGGTLPAGVKARIWSTGFGRETQHLLEANSTSIVSHEITFEKDKAEATITLPFTAPQQVETGLGDHRVQVHLEPVAGGFWTKDETLKWVEVWRAPRVVHFADDLVAEGAKPLAADGGTTKEVLLQLDVPALEDTTATLGSPHVSAPGRVITAVFKKGKRTAVAKVPFAKAAAVHSLAITKIEGKNVTLHTDAKRTAVSYELSLPKVRFDTPPLEPMPRIEGGKPVLVAGQKHKFRLKLDRPASTPGAIRVACATFLEDPIDVTIAKDAIAVESPEFTVKPTSNKADALAVLTRERFCVSDPAPKAAELVVDVRKAPELYFAEIGAENPVHIVGDKVAITVAARGVLPVMMTPLRAYIVGTALGEGVKVPVEIPPGRVDKRVTVTLAKLRKSHSQSLYLERAENCEIAREAPAGGGTAYKFELYATRGVQFAALKAVGPDGGHVESDRVEVTVMLDPPLKQGESKVKIGGPVAAEVEVKFGPGEKAKTVAVTLSGDNAAPQQLTLSSPVNCTLGERTQVPILVHIPEIAFGSPAFMPARPVPGGRVTVWLESAKPAPAGGARVKVSCAEFEKPLVATFAPGATRTYVIANVKPGATTAQPDVVLEPLALEGTGVPGHATASYRGLRCKVKGTGKQPIDIAVNAGKIAFDGDLPGPVVDVKSTATLRVKPSEAPAADIVVKLTSKAFGPVVHDVRLPKGSVLPVAKEVTFAVGHPENALKEMPVTIEAPDGWRADPAENKGKFNIKVKAPVSRTVMPCGLPVPAAVAANGAAAVVAAPAEARIEPDPCNLVRLYVVEQHGTEKEPKAAERGTKGAWEIVADRAAAKTRDALVWTPQKTPVIQVIAGRGFDPLVDDDGAKFHETRLLVQASQDNSYCERIEETPRGTHRHPHLKVEQYDGGSWIPLDGVPTDVRDLVKGATEAADGTLATFKVEQAHHFWHEGEAVYKKDEEDDHEQLTNELLDFRRGRRMWGVRDIMTGISLPLMKPRKYRIEAASCGIPDPAKDFAPANRIAAEIEVFPSDEFAFVWQYESKLDGVRIGKKGTYYDPGAGGADIKKGDQTRDKVEVELDDPEAEDDAEVEFGEKRAPGLATFEAPDFKEELPKKKKRERGQARPATKVFHPVDDVPEVDNDDPYKEGVDDVEREDWDDDTEETKKKHRDMRAELDGDSSMFGTDTAMTAALSDYSAMNKYGAEKLKIALLRNGQSTPLYENVTTSIASVVDAMATVFKVWRGVRDWVPSVGWGFQFNMKFLEGNLIAQWGYKEGAKNEVFRWVNVQTDLTIIDLGLTFDYGVKLEAFVVEFSAVAYLKLTCALSLKNFGFERTDPTAEMPAYEFGDSVGTFKDGAIETEAKIEAGVNVVLMHENVFKFNGAIKSGLKFKFRPNLHLEKHPLSLETEMYWLGIVVSAEVSSKAFKKKEFSYTIIQGNPEGLPFMRKVMPEAAAQGFWNTRSIVTGAWKKAHLQQKRIEEAIAAWQKVQLELVAASKQSRAWKTDASAVVKANEPSKDVPAAWQKNRRNRAVKLNFSDSWVGKGVKVVGKNVAGDEVSEVLAFAKGADVLSTTRFHRVERLESTGFATLDAGLARQTLETPLKVEGAKLKVKVKFAEGWNSGDVRITGKIGVARETEVIAAPAAAGVVEGTKEFDELFLVESLGVAGKKGATATVFAGDGTCTLSTNGGPKYPFTKVLPGVQCPEEDAKDATKKKQWDSNLEQWNAQWAQCKRAFYEESRTVEKRITIRTVDLTTRLNELAASCESLERELKARHARVASILVKLKTLDSDIEEEEKKAGEGIACPESLRERAKAIDADKDLEWVQRASRTPAAQFEELFTDLRYYAALRRRW